jgi:hypothetical protein
MRRARTLLDHIAEVPPREFRRIPLTLGKLKKDDFYWEGTRDWIEDRFIGAHNRRRPGRYIPRQMAKNFYDSSAPDGANPFWK